MDGPKFDDLVRTIARSRRALLGLGAALGLGPLLAGAKKRKKRKGKKKNTKKACSAGNPVRCGKFCCRSDESCRNGACVDHCQDGQQNFGETGTDCGGTCRVVRKCQLGQTCAIDEDCFNAACVNRRDIGASICVECRIDSDCDRLGDPERFRCINNLCFACSLDEDCPRPGQGANKRFCVEPVTRVCPENTRCVCAECRTSDDCQAGELCDENNACIAGACAAGRDVCQDLIPGCNGDPTCHCRQAFASTQSFCAANDGLQGVNCTGDAICASVIQTPGVRCVKTAGPGCGGAADVGVCVVPCS